MELRNSPFISSIILLFILLCIVVPKTQIYTLISSTQSHSPPQLRILVGVFTMADRYESRNLLRLVYGAQLPIGAHIDVRFIMCRLTNVEQRIIVGLEIMKYDDIIILNCRENMNDGKTYTYFSTLPRLFESNLTNPPYHYIAKADDDTYIRLQHLVESLQYAAREDAYYGHKVKTPDQEFMTGTFYLVSWDIVEWISITDIDEKYHPIHFEDVIFSHWLRDGNIGKNQYDMKEKIYDIPGPGHHYPHELWSGTISVHKLKTREKWIQTLDYFNVTKNLKPSKFYRYP